MIRYAISSGNWSNPLIWDGGASLPTVGDDVYANGFTVTIDQDITVAKISTEVCPSTSVGGGQFIRSSQYIIANIVAGTTLCLYNTIGGTPFYVIGNVYGGTAANAFGIYIVVVGGGVGAAPIVIGNVYGGSGGNAHGISGPTNRTIGLNLTGNVYGGIGGGGFVSPLGGVGSTGLNVTVTGNVTSTVQSGIITPLGNVIINGVITASSTSVGVNCGGIVYIQGNLINVAGNVAIYSSKLFITPTTTSVWTIQDSNDTNVLFYTAGAFNYPAEANVRSGISYGTIYTGTCAVPAATEVVKGVPVDNTVGTWAFDTELITRLQQCSTVPITGQQIASYNGAPAELIPYNEKRTDYVSGTPDILYLGTAPVGTLDSSPVWNLTKLELAIDGSITSETHATDSWDNHLTAIYS